MLMITVKEDNFRTIVSQTPFAQIKLMIFGFSVESAVCKRNEAICSDVLLLLAQ